jgi:uncharacterized membrane protein YhiD involved in acid resistance
MDSIQQSLVDASFAFIYQPKDIVLNLGLAFLLGMVISAIYKRTHKGLSYSQSFMLTIVFVTLIVSMVMMVIGNNLARAFALVGALSIIRFRTVIKDTKDTAYVFMALAGGMASGTSSYFLAAIGTSIFAIVSYVLYLTNYGAFFKSEFILRFRVKSNINQKNYSDVIGEYSRRSSLLHVDPSEDNMSSLLTYDISLKKDTEATSLSKAINAIDEISEVALIASKSDVDY